MDEGISALVISMLRPQIVTPPLPEWVSGAFTPISYGRFQQGFNTTRMLTG